jgi:hypothetical protein
VSEANGRQAWVCERSELERSETRGDKARKKHGDRYDYSKVKYINSKTKIIIICKTHGEFEQIAGDHSNGAGCFKCNCKLSYSKLAIEWLDYISSKEKIYIQHALNDGEFKIPNSNYKADGYCKDTNTILEFLGSRFHGAPDLYNRNDINPINYKTYGELYDNTIKRTNFIISQGFNYVEIWEHHWNKIIKSVKIIQRSWRYFKDIDKYNYKCHKCLYKSNNIYGWNEHIKTKKHNL